MKKFGFLLLGAAALTMASCSQEDIVNPSVGDGNYNVTVKLPVDGVTTRALGTGYAADMLYLAVYDLDNNTFVYQDLTLGFDGQLQTTVSLNLATGKKYGLAFFAQSPLAQETGVYNFNAGGRTLTVNYDKMTSDYNLQDAYDCFYRFYETGVIGTNPQTETIELYRPVAQVNWGTNDLSQPMIADAFGPTGEYIRASLSTTAYNTLDMFTSEVIGTPDTEVELLNWEAPIDEFFPVNGYDYVAMQYLLAPSKDPTVYDLTLTVNNSGREEGATMADNVIDVASAPVQANYRTNIYGNLLSDNIEYVVRKDPEWGTPDYNFELIDGQEYLVITTANASSVKNGGNLILGSDIVYPGANTYVPLTKSSNINLNGFSLTSQGYKPATGSQTGDAIVVGSGANVKISNGTLLPATVNALADGSSATINLMSSTGGSLTLNNVNVVGNMYPVMLTSSNPNSNITINGGSFTFTDKWTDPEYTDKLACVYITGQGTITINSGTFGMPGVHSEFLLNIQDNLRYPNTDKMPNQIITVKGGTFINFDPSNNRAEGPGTNFLAPGYKVIANEVGDDMYYTVVPSSANVVETKDGLANALANAKNGDTIIVGAGVDYTMPVNFDKNVTIKGLGADVTTLNSPMSYNASKGANLVFEDLTLKTFVNNANHTSMGFQGSANLTFNNVTIDGQFYVFTGNADFNNCTFEYNAFTQRNSDYQLVHQSSGNVNITNCVMDCGPTGAVSVDAGWAVTEPTIAGGNLYIKGLSVNASAVNDTNAVVDINSRGYTTGGTVSINQVTYDASQFPMGLWNQNNGNGETTNLFTVLVNGKQVN